MRDEAALETFFSDLVDAYPTNMGAFSERSRISIAQMKMTVRIPIRREQHGDIGAIADLDRIEAMLEEHRQHGGKFPNAGS